MKRITGKKGFTLAELLIVVAIIGVLVAISIPIFTSQLKKARLATNQANARAAYAAAMAWYIDNTDTDDDNAKAVGMYDISTGVFTPGINVPDGTKLVADITKWTSEGRNVADRRNAGEQVYKKWDVYWSDSFDGTVSSYIAHD